MTKDRATIYNLHQPGRTPRRPSAEASVGQRPGDTPKVAEAIRTLTARGYDIGRPTNFQLKIGDVNYYPDTGTIKIDTRRNKEPVRGLAALLALLERMGA